MTSVEGCRICPSGYFCDSTGISKISRWPCPSGHFCLNNTLSPLACPGGHLCHMIYSRCSIDSVFSLPGYYRNQVGGRKQTDCSACPPGRMCPPGSSVYQSCPQGHFCNGYGNVNGTACPPGYYCPANTTVPSICACSQILYASIFFDGNIFQGPPEYFCPIRTVVPQPCYR